MIQVQYFATSFAQAIPKTSRILAICMTTLALFIPVSAVAADYDLVILNGRVMDPESGLDGIRNVGVSDGRIAAVTTESIKGKQSIDASVQGAREMVLNPEYKTITRNPK